jgi:hypothetical protein
MDDLLRRQVARLVLQIHGGFGQCVLRRARRADPDLDPERLPLVDPIHTRGQSRYEPISPVALGSRTTVMSIRVPPIC